MQEIFSSIFASFMPYKNGKIKKGYKLVIAYYIAIIVFGLIGGIWTNLYYDNNFEFFRLISIVGWILPYMITGKCPLVVGERCLEMKSIKPWIRIYKGKSFFIFALVVAGASDALYAIFVFIEKLF